LFGACAAAVLLGQFAQRILENAKESGAVAKVQAILLPSATPLFFLEHRCLLDIRDALLASCHNLYTDIILTWISLIPPGLIWT
jgi:hypothetical protein